MSGLSGDLGRQRGGLCGLARGADRGEAEDAAGAGEGMVKLKGPNAGGRGGDVGLILWGFGFGYFCFVCEGVGVFGIARKCCAMLLSFRAGAWGVFGIAAAGAVVLFHPQTKTNSEDTFAQGPETKRNCEDEDCALKPKVALRRRMPEDETPTRKTNSPKPSSLPKPSPAQKRLAKTCFAFAAVCRRRAVPAGAVRGQCGGRECGEGARYERGMWCRNAESAAA